jgi:hypothetical protein
VREDDTTGIHPTCSVGDYGAHICDMGRNARRRRVGSARVGVFFDAGTELVKFISESTARVSLTDVLHHSEEAVAVVKGCVDVRAKGRHDDKGEDGSDRQLVDKHELGGVE